jgi:transglutaminase-like putative cysteine protease
MRLSIDALLDYDLTAPADLLFAVEVAQMADQRLVEDRLTIGGVEPLVPITGEEGVGRRTWTRGTGRFTARYTALVDIERIVPDIATLPADDLRTLPAMVVPYLFPSRYCEADKFRGLICGDFAHLAGGAKVAAMSAWIGDHLAYLPGTSDIATTAVDTFVSRQGVCRDYAHLLIAMVRAADIPARMVAGYAWNLNPPDFHALVEVWLGGAWQLIDPTRLAQPEAIARIGVGRDATDISFLTIFGEARLIEQRVSVSRLDSP